MNTKEFTINTRDGKHLVRRSWTETSTRGNIGRTFRGSELQFSWPVWHEAVIWKTRKGAERNLEAARRFDATAHIVSEIL